MFCVVVGEVAEVFSIWFSLVVAEGFSGDADEGVVPGFFCGAAAFVGDDFGDHVSCFSKGGDGESTDGEFW